MSTECDETRPAVPRDALPGLDQAQLRGTSARPRAVVVRDIGGGEAARETHWEPDPSRNTSKVVGLFLLVALERIVLADEMAHH